MDRLTGVIRARAKSPMGETLLVLTLLQATELEELYKQFRDARWVSCAEFQVCGQNPKKGAAIDR